MTLHNSLDFKDYILSTANYFNIPSNMIEKDYYVTLILQRLSRCIPGLMFKGGTCLSKCFGIIDRFSEDIDLTLNVSHFTQSNKRNANKMILKTCDELGFNLINREQVELHSHGNYNKYQIEYPSSFSMIGIKPFIQVEIVFIQKAYPEEIKEAKSYVYDWAKATGVTGILKTKELQPFNIIVQSLERTLIDKVYALCDYYLRDEPNRNSRHIYDVYKILPYVNIDTKDIRDLFNSVREDRRPNRMNLSAQEGIDVQEILKRIVDTHYYEKDYISSTEALLTKPCKYSEAILGLEQIVQSRFVNPNI